MRGRPHTTLNRIEHYLDKHYPCSRGQVERALDLDRSYLNRALKVLAKKKPDAYFCQLGSVPQSL